MTSPGWTRTNRLLTDWVWDPWTMRALVALTVGWLLWRRERLPALWVICTAALGTVAQQGLKAAVGRDRPQWPDPVDSAHYAAFPSGHALTATVTFGLVLWVLWTHHAAARWLRVTVVVAAVSVAGVGFSRLFLGVHWLSDVLAGWLLELDWCAPRPRCIRIAADGAGRGRVRSRMAQSRHKQSGPEVAATECGGRAEVTARPVRELLPGNRVPLGESPVVRRLLPSLGLRMIGAWCFADHYGPDDIAREPGMRAVPARRSPRRGRRAAGSAWSAATTEPH